MRNAAERELVKRPYKDIDWAKSMPSNGYYYYSDSDHLVSIELKGVEYSGALYKLHAAIEYSWEPIQR